MKLEGVHHVTAITGDARANVDFYTRVMGMRLVKKTVNQDDPTVYHLFYGDEEGAPGYDLTFFEYPGARRGRAGDGMVHTVVFRVGATAALDFWGERLKAEGIATVRGADRLAFEDPEGLGLELRVEDVPDAPLVAEADDIPAEHAIQGFAGVRAYASYPDRSRAILERPLSMEHADGTRWDARGHLRGGFIEYEQPPLDRGVPGGGTVHHVAWAIPLGAEQQWLQRVTEAGTQTSGLIDRFYFRSIYFREPSGILFELATMGPGFTVDEDAATLGESVALPPFLEPLRERIEAALTPLDGVGRQRSSVR
jgi:glyoxalase family protein